VDELIMYFTHDRTIDFMLPGIPPTGRKVVLPHVVVMKFKGGKVAHEHIYWDQACVLAQIGLLDPSKLPVTGAQQAEALVENRDASEREPARTSACPHEIRRLLTRAGSASRDGDGRHRQLSTPLIMARVTGKDWKR
jgi:hypothetical protein